MTWSASHFSSTTMARRSAARVPVAPAKTFRTRDAWRKRSAFLTMSSIMRRGSRTPSSASSPTAILPARRRCRALPATRRSSSAICCGPQRSSAPRRLPPVTMSGAGLARGLRALPGAGCRARPELLPVRRTPAQLNFLRFPLGDLDKETRASLPASSGFRPLRSLTARTSASCRPGAILSVIERLRPGAAEPGDIVHVDGHVLGRHGGIINYTIGQRRGIGVAAAEPLYVVKLDAKRREVVVGPRGAVAHAPYQLARRELARR